MKKRFIILQKKYMIVIGIISLLIITLCTSYAIFTVNIEEKGKLNIIAGNLYGRIESKDLIDNKVINIEPDSYLLINVNMININNLKSKHSLYYKILSTGIRESEIEIGYLKGTQNPENKILNAYLETDSTMPVKLVIQNKSDKTVQIEINSQAGLENAPLKLLNDRIIINQEKRMPLDIKEIETGYNHTFLLTSSNELYGVGYNLYGQLGDNTNENQESAIKIMDKVIKVSGGQYHSLILTDTNELYATGQNEFGQLGDNTNENRPTPIKVMDDVKQIAAGSGHSLIITNENKLYAMGLNTYGQLGNNSKVNSNTPVEIMSNVKQVVGGQYHSLILTDTNEVYVVGRNNYGQLGIDTPEDVIIPTKVMDKIQYLYTGASHSILLDENGKWYISGYNEHGQLGDETVEDKNKFTKIYFFSKNQ